jgi:tRNA(fMet)-specific endonuclease VapC
MNGNSAALDTNQAIAILNDSPAAIAFYSTFDELILPATVIGELRFGALNSQRSSENLEKVDRLAARCRVVDTTATTAIPYAQIRMQLKQIGHPTRRTTFGSPLRAYNIRSHWRPPIAISTPFKG